MTVQFKPLPVAALVALLFAGVATSTFASSAPEGASTPPVTAKAESQEAGSEAASAPTATPDASAEVDTAEVDTAEVDKAEEDPNDPWAGKEWFFDEERNRRYIIEQIPKVARAYRWESDTTIRLPGGLRVEVVDHDPSSFWVKLYEPRSRKPRSQPSNEPSEEELQRVADAYETDLESVDRLKMEFFDRGLPKSGQWRNGFDIADMNDDGHLDIVFGPARKGRTRPNIFLGSSDGVWKQWLTAKYPDLAYDYGDAEAGDWNGDGKMDLAFGVHLRGMLALIGDGEGNFQAWTEGIQFDVPGKGGDASSFSSRAITSRDWNDDGKVDLIALGEGPKGSRRGIQDDSREGGMNSSKGLVVYLNQGDGTWQPSRLSSGRDFGDEVVFGDIDGDGIDEALVASRVQNNRYILHKQTEGGLLEPMAVEDLRPLVFVTAIEMEDLDGNGRDDLIVGYRNREAGVWRTGVDLFYSHEDGLKRRPLLAFGDSFKGVTSIAVGEIDGRPGKDLVAMTGEAEVLLFVGDGEGYFLQETSPESPTPIKGCHGYGARLVDFDGDGRDELVAGFAGESTSALGMTRDRYPGCPGQGRLSAWKLADKPAPAPPASSDAPATEAAEGEGR